MKHIVHSLHVSAQDILLAAPPKPGRKAPGPLKEAVNNALSLASWVGTAAGVAGVIITGAMMAVSMKQGQGSDHLPRLGMVMGGCVLIATAGPVIGFFF
ncbi:hypothetical protein GCM10009801_12380 [Streptomyces albiaxialis]|uniref:Conjugal transfer protein TrbC n=1 Tax=Streptomyces albiaxialis TaxID=329523 RepID=A0ABN2VMF0_9ACTN